MIRSSSKKGSEAAEGFAVHHILEPETIKIPAYREMRVYQRIKVVGKLENKGKLIVKVD